jgi:hypothetical protein
MKITLFTDLTLSEQAKPSGGNLSGGNTNKEIPSSNTSFNKAMNPEQLSHILEAILDGKYSWACVLLLRSAGYNPLEYIPYRTYSRLVKENSQICRSRRHETSSTGAVNKCSAEKPTGKSSHNYLN